MEEKKSQERVRHHLVMSAIGTEIQISPCGNTCSGQSMMSAQEGGRVGQAPAGPEHKLPCLGS